MSAPSTLLLIASLTALPPDEFLHPSERDLRPREREALVALRQELAHPAPEKRDHAVRRMAAIGKAAVPVLVELYDKGSDPQKVRNAALALGAIGATAGYHSLERALQSGTLGEDALRATLVALASKQGYWQDATLREVRRLSHQASLDTVRQVAALVAGSRASSQQFAGLAGTLRGPLRSERNRRTRGCYLLALAEADSAAVFSEVARILARRDGELVRRSALYFVARHPDPEFARRLERFRPRGAEVPAYALALGADPGAGFEAILGRLLGEYGPAAGNALFSLARIGTPEALGLLGRALEGKLHPELRRPAVLSVAALADPQPFLERVRALAERGDPELRSAALLVLARVGDPESARRVRQQLPEMRDPELVERALLLAALHGDGDPCENLRLRSATDLCATIDDVRRGRKSRRLLEQRVVELLTREGAHWLLRRDDLRDGLVVELLELDRVSFLDRDDEPAGGDDGGADGGGDGGGEVPSEGGDDGGTPPPTGDGVIPPPAPAPGGGLRSRRRDRNDFARFEADLLLWLQHHPLFAAALPFGDPSGTESVGSAPSSAVVWPAKER